MILRTIVLRNIRSYNSDDDTTVEIPEGVTLFEGDIGAGKSTLLYALEFALFGFSDMKGTHLLSEGKREGSVLVTLESEGTKYTIHRKLRTKGEDVIQDECYISNGGEKTRLSPSDLKERVVSILGFNEPTHPRAESLVYRYAVFTPQEQMKQILVQYPEERLHVVRRVLGAQSYQVAAENSELVERRIREVSYGLQRASADLEEKKSKVDDKSRERNDLKGEVAGLREEEKAAADNVSSLNAEWKQWMSKREELNMKVGKIPTLTKEKETLEEDIASGQEGVSGLETELRQGLDPLIKNFESRAKPEHKAKVFETKVNEMRDSLTNLKNLKENIETELENTKDLLAKGVCPQCGQLITGDFIAKSKHAEGELLEVGDKIKKESAVLEKEIELLSLTRSYEEDEKDYVRAKKDREKITKEIATLRKKLDQSTSRLAALKSELTEAESNAMSMKETAEAIASLELRLDEARKEDKDIGQRLSRARTRLTDVEGEIESLTKEVKEKQKSLEEAQRLATYQSWLSSFFRPTVQLIEKQTLALAANRFNEHFQRFFTTLVDDPDMVVRVREDFTPLFEREGFEQEYGALSGGERTSMALAYRFALNSVVRESFMTRPELVILDEPTDGFSREQLHRMRGLLEELDSKQVILVSHERELESMADHIFRVEKRDGTSRISVVEVAPSRS